MMKGEEFEVIARRIIDSNRFMTNGTADAQGRSWAPPVWFANEGYRDFLWVSGPGARDPRNVAARPGLALVVFDSTAAPGDAAVVYAEGRGEELANQETAHLDVVEERWRPR
jgi:Pyridoxamine 5'-phosphate oxidase